MFSLEWLLRRIRRRKTLGLALLTVVLVGSVVGNALTYYFFDRGSNPDLTVPDAFWYSVISITTIGYGDFSATTTGARIGTVIFINNAPLVTRSCQRHITASVTNLDSSAAITDNARVACVTSTISIIKL